MKRIFITLLVITFATGISSAQFAFEGGLCMPNMKIKAAGSSVSTSMVYKGNIGLLWDFSLGGKIFFEPGLAFEMGGCKVTSDPKTEYNLNIADIQLDLLYKSGERCGKRFFFGAGVNRINILGGSFSQEAFKGAEARSGSIKIGTGTDAVLKSSCFGMNVNVGYVFKRHFYARVKYIMGLENVQANGDADNSIKTSAICVNLGFYISRCSEGGSYISLGRGGRDHWRGVKKLRNSRRNTHRTQSLMGL
jgi:Outer membrane protein beta-barrel domain